MRDIRFRVKSKNNNQWGIIFLLDIEEIDWGLFDKETLGQYIGLKDMDGKEIYEGDLIDFGGLKPLEIVWHESGFKARMYDSYPIFLRQEAFSAFVKIIGNIYQNPELLVKTQT